MRDPFRSKAHLYEYVVAELKALDLHDRIDLSIAFQDPSPLFSSPPTHELWWTISSSMTGRSQHLLSRHYLLEARYDERQFVIWFGYLTGFIGPSPRDVIRPAVHVMLPSPPGRELIPAESGMSINPLEEDLDSRSKAHGLGPVIRWMLDHEDQASDQWDPMVYPLSGGRY